MNRLADFPHEVQLAASAARDEFRDGATIAVVVARAIMADRASRRVRVAGLTAHQKRVLDYLSSFFAEHGICPSYEEIQAFLGLASKSGVHRVIVELEERGAIRRLPGRSRAITIITPTAT